MKNFFDKNEALSVGVNPLSPTGAPWQRIEVMPVFFVPSDEQAPTQQLDLFRKHLELARERYRTMLKSRDTFALSSTTAVYRSGNDLDFFRSKKERMGDFMLAEVLDFFQVDRHTCPYVFVLLLMNPHEPAMLIPEDLNSLFLNRRVFPDFWFDRKTDILEGYAFVNSIISLWPPVEIPGLPKYKVLVSSDTPAEEGSIENVVPKFIESPNSTKKENLWVSGEVPENRWITFLIEFPQTERLTAVVLHSQHGGSINRAEALRIECADENGFFTKIIETGIDAPDTLVRFTPATARQWRLSVKPGQSRKVTMRGLELFNGDIQLYPPLYPYKLFFTQR